MLSIALICYFLALALVVKAIDANIVAPEDHVMLKGVFRFRGHRVVCAGGPCPVK